MGLNPSGPSVFQTLNSNVGDFDIFIAVPNSRTCGEDKAGCLDVAAL